MKAQAGIFALLFFIACSKTPEPSSTESAAKPAELQTFSASAGFSSTQGQNGWTYIGSTGEPLTYRPTDYPSPQDTWQGSEKYLIVSRNGGHPGENQDSIRRWTAKEAGTVRITGNVHDGDPECGFGVRVFIRKNTVALWQQDVRNGDATGMNFEVTTPVQQNDTIDFVINKGVDGNNRCDSTEFDPTIVLQKK